MSHVGKGDIHAYLDGALGAYPEAEDVRIRQHLGECELCARSLDEERQIRLVASEILAATADAPVDLAPFEELVIRAGEGEPTPRSGGASGFRTLRMAATIVVSLGAGWVARDLTTPARDLATTPSLNAVIAAQGAASRANEAADPFQEESEDRQASRGDFAAQAVVPARSPDLNAEAESATVRALIPEAPAAPLDVPAARRESAEEREIGRRDGAGSAIGLAQQRASEARPQAALAAEPAERSRLEAGANALIALDEVSVTEGVGSFVIPGLPIRDVRMSGVIGGAGSAVTIVHELPDGRTVELRFVTSEGDDARRKVAGREAEGPEASERDVVVDSEGFRDPDLPEGWSQVVRAVPGGLAILRGPLGEAGLSELLDRAVAGR